MSPKRTDLNSSALREYFQVSDSDIYFSIDTLLLWLMSVFSSNGKCFTVQCMPKMIVIKTAFNRAKNSALIWQKEASDKSDISRKRAKCVCHLHWRQWNIMMSYLTYLLVGWVFLHEIWPGRRAHYVNYENINNSNLDGMSLASFCQSRAELCRQDYIKELHKMFPK